MRVRGRHGVVAALAVAAAAVGVAGCGSDAEEAKSSLDEALGYLPKDAGFVLVASTDSSDYDGLQKVLNKFPFGGQAKDLIQERLESGGTDFDDDVKPLLGNEVVLGVVDNARFTDGGSDTPFVLALEAQDADRLQDLASKNTSDEGESEGYDIYQGEEDDTWLAVKDEAFVLSNDEDTLKGALKQRGEDDRLTEDDLEPTFEDLPQDAPVRAHVNVEALIAADRDARQALEIEWVDHIETLGITADATENLVSIRSSLRVDPEGLTDKDLPLAAGDGTPQVLEREDGSDEIVFALREPARVIAFAQTAAAAADPDGFGRFEAKKRRFGEQLGIDVDRDVIDQLTGDLAGVATIDGRFGVRVGLDDPAAFERTLAKAMEGLPALPDNVAITPPSGGESFYTVTTDGGEKFAVGVASKALVVASDARMAGDVATRGFVHALGQEGAFVMAADAEQVANAALAKYGSGLQALGGSLFTGPLGDFASSASASTEGISSRLELKIE